jgi:hypothetical protein
MAYVGQTGRDFLTRFNEHKRSFRLNNNNSKYAAHILDNQHTFGQIQDVMQILQVQRKGPHLNKAEKFYIHKEAAKNNHLNDKHTVTNNRIFDTILREFRSNPP